MLSTILIILATAIITTLALATRKPDEFRVTRITIINAAPVAIYPHVASTRAWQPWSPWSKMDPLAEVSFAGPESGVGASHTWKGKKTGEGTMTVTEARPSEFVQFRLDFRKPMVATNYAEFTFATLNPTTTQVTWTMYGKNTFMGKVMSTFMDCDTMVGTQFANGLRDLKEVAEGKSFGQTAATGAAA